MQLKNLSGEHLCGKPMLKVLKMSPASSDTQLTKDIKDAAIFASLCFQREICDLCDDYTPDVKVSGIHNFPCLTFQSLMNQ